MRILLCIFILSTFIPFASASMPSVISAPGERMILINPKIHEWGAYMPNGRLVRSGIATTGKAYCPDIHAPCRTRVGTFRIFSLGDASCKSERFPIKKGGGAPMPYCMYFSGDQALHGASPWKVAKANLSHGCVRTQTADARWLRYNFVEWHTLVRVLPY